MLAIKLPAREHTWGNTHGFCPWELNRLSSQGVSGCRFALGPVAPGSDGLVAMSPALL